MSTNSSERTVTAATLSTPATPNTLSTAHHFVSMKLTTKNYLFWRTQLVPFLRGQGLLGFVTGDTPCPPATVIPPATSDAGSGGTTSTTVANPAHALWEQQDQSILSLLISSMSDEVLYLAVGRGTSHEVWTSITAALGSSTRARCLNLLAQFQSLRQGNSTPGEYLGRAQLLVEDLALAGRPVSLDEQNLYVFRGLRPEFRSMASSLAASGAPISIPQLSDFLQAQEFIWADDFSMPSGVPAGGSHTAMVAGRSSNHHSGGPRRGGSGRGRDGNGRGRGGNGRGRGGVSRCQICRSQGHTAVYCYQRYTG
ncbi:PREDICTED: uncharacterized protein LOC109179033 [Ipomoea nil]|uniref:uncharacterized protein LOC109179033 n=1 Tax=Ipomoea nil TaxID=35883 RepID=UPI000900F318|nr:PREDICTED: uncharacterized protein LOC109179033 [Ipomoea nil]